MPNQEKKYDCTVCSLNFSPKSENMNFVLSSDQGKVEKCCLRAAAWKLNKPATYREK